MIRNFITQIKNWFYKKWMQHQYGDDIITCSECQYYNNGTEYCGYKAEHCEAIHWKWNNI